MHVQNYSIKLLADEPLEHFVVVCPNNQNRLIGEETMSIGIINQTKVYLSEVLSAALKHHARSVFLMHNHIT